MSSPAHSTREGDITIRVVRADGKSRTFRTTFEEIDNELTANPNANNVLLNVWSHCFEGDARKEDSPPKE